MTRQKSTDGRGIIVNFSYPVGRDINSYVSKKVVYGRVFPHQLPTTDQLVDIVKHMKFQAYAFSVPFLAAAGSRLWRKCIYWYCHALRRKDVLTLHAESVAEFITKSLHTENIKVLIYLDDVVGVASEDKAMHNFQCNKDLLLALGHPLAEAMSVPPTHCITWLGITFDIPSHTVAIPIAKVHEILRIMEAMYKKKAMNRKDLQQLAGRRNYIARACRPACLFMNRILAQLRGHPIGYTRVTAGTQADIRWFLDFLPAFNGVSLVPASPPVLLIEADSCMEGGGALAGDRCYTYAYTEWIKKGADISQLEAINCLAAIQLFVEAIHTGHTIEVQCDNSTAIAVYTSSKGKDPVILSCARGIWQYVAALDCFLVFTYIPGVLMVAADTLSRVCLSTTHANKAITLIQDRSLTRLYPDESLFNCDLFR